MMNTMIKKSPNQVPPIPRRNNEIRDEEIDNDDGIIYPPGYSVASPIPIDDPNSLPLVSAVLIEEHNTHSAEEGRLPTQNSEESHSNKPDSRFDPFRPIHPQCNHISYGCLTMVFIVFVCMTVLLKTYLPVILPPSISTEPSHSPSFLPTVNRSNPPSMYLSMYPSHPPSITKYEEKKLVASYRSYDDRFGKSCSMSGELVVIGTPYVGGDIGAAYLFHLDGTEVKKLSNDGDNYDNFGEAVLSNGGKVVVGSVSMDEKIVVGSNGGYLRVFSRNGTYERKLTCGDCKQFGSRVATLGNLIVTRGEQNSIWKLFIFTTEDGQLVKKLDQGSGISDVAISEEFIVSAGPRNGGKTIIYSNSSPDFPVIAEINQGGKRVAVAGDRIVIGDTLINYYDGAAYLYKTDGTLVTALDSQDSTRTSQFGESVAITDDKVLVGAYFDDDQGYRSGSVFIYSAVTGEFLEKVVAPDAKAHDWFGTSLCASNSHYVVGASGDDSNKGAAYLFQFSDE